MQQNDREQTIVREIYKTNMTEAFTAGMMMLAMGAAMGFAMGLFSAKKPGKDLKKELESNSKEFLDDAIVKVRKINSEIDKKISEYKNNAKFDTYFKTLKTRSQELRDKLEKLVHN